VDNDVTNSTFLRCNQYPYTLGNYRCCGTTE